MKINRKTHRDIRIHNLLFSILFLVVVGLIGWISTKYSTQFDWTASHRHTLSDASRKVLGLLEGPVTVTAYARENQALRQQIRDIVDRYSRVKPDLSLRFVNPDIQPDKVRELGITMDGEMILDYQGRTEKLQDPSEAALSNALQRLASAAERHVVFLEGHGERSPDGQANHDLKQFGDELRRKGFILTRMNLGMTTVIPDNTDVLVIAGPRSKLLPGEVAMIESYVKRGGNLWWMADPGDLHGLGPLGSQLGVRFLPGIVVDASTQLLGIDDPTFALVAEYPPHPVTLGFQEMTMFPSAAAIDAPQGGDFERDVLLSTLPRSWTETGPIEGDIRMNAEQGERQGPLDIGIALTRQVTPAPVSAAPAAPPAKPEPAAGGDKTSAATPAKVESKSPDGKKPESGAAAEPPKPGEPPANPAPAEPIQQRIVVTGDGDFLSNAYLGNGGNLNLGVNIVQWLSRSDALINIPAKLAPDQKLELSSAAMVVIAGGFLVVLPLLLIGTGAWIWFKRRRR